MACGIKKVHGIFVYVMGMAAACALSACTDHRAGNTATVNSVTATYLFYRNSLNAVDPANPTVPIVIEPLGTIGNVTAIEHATYQPAPLYFLYDRHYDTIVYRKSAAGTLWKVSALKSGNLTPAQVSNETTATVAFCASLAEPDYADPLNAEFVYRLPGVDNVCGNWLGVCRNIHTPKPRRLDYGSTPPCYHFHITLLSYFSN